MDLIKKYWKEQCNSVISYAKQNTYARKSENGVSNSPQKTLPPEIMSKIKSYSNNKESNKQIALKQIQDLLTKL